MKPRFLDVIGNALGMVRKSNVSEATALIREALSGRGGGGAERAPDAPRPSPAAPPSARRPLGEVLRALGAARSHLPRTAPAPEPHRPRAPVANEQNFATRGYTGPAGGLDYRLYVPADHASRDLALVVMLHGCTQDPEDFAVGTRMNDLADEFGLIVAYPRQSRSANPNVCWNWFDKRHQFRDAGEPAKLAGLTREVASEFGIGKDRIFVAGLSAGGAMAEVLAATYPELYAAAGIHSGLPYLAATDVMSAFAAMKGTSVVNPNASGAEISGCRKIVFHGGADATVHPANGKRILDGAQRRAGALEKAHFEWDADGGHVQRTALRDADGRSVVEHWFVEGGQHAWFGGDPRGTFTQGVGVDASREMVRFFLSR